MKRTLAVIAAAIIVFAATDSLNARRRGGVSTSTGGAPAATAELIVTQGGGNSVCSNNAGSGCLTNTAILIWPASSGATYYTVSRNGSALGSGGCSGSVTGTTCTDATATNMNRVNTYGDETTYGYTIQACNGSGCSGTTSGAHWLYHGQAYNSCANYSGGGYGGYSATTPVVNVSNGSNILTVTNVGTYTIGPYATVADQSANGGGGQNLIPFSAGTGGLGNPYILPYGSGSTTGTGGNGTYEMSANATGNYTGDVIYASPGGYSQNGMEACNVTGTTELSHTYAMTFTWPTSGAYVQQYVASPGAVSYDMNIGDTTYSRIDVYTSSLSHGLTYTIHSRPGANDSGTGDIYSSRFITVYNQSGVSSYCTTATNAWFTCLIPNTALGLGTGTFTGYVQANWHGTLTIASNGATTATLTGTTDGNYANIVSGDYIMVHSSQGWTCILAGSTPTGPTGTMTISGGCASGIGTPSVTSVEATDAQVCASSASVQPGPDNAGLIQGNSEPDATYFGGGVIGFSGSPNTTGVGTCTGTGNGHWGLFNGNATAITSQGSSGSQLTWTARRTSIYKPEFQQMGGSGTQTNFVDMIGWQ